MADKSKSTVAMPVLGADGRAQAAVSLTTQRMAGTLDGFIARSLPPLTRVVDRLSRAVRLSAAA